MRGYLGKPFVKWVGGKTQLIPEIVRRLPEDFAMRDDIVYVEPFVGGGAMLFHMLQAFPNISRAYINDINRELITAYTVVRDTPEALLTRLDTLQREYLPLDEPQRKAYYLHQRDIYNSKSTDDITTAALLIFLNRTCFNGLYRVNAKGAFNVPHGRYAHPQICDETTIMADSALLQRVTVTCGDFASTIAYATRESLFYLDPPYKPLSNTSSFNSYSKEAFDDNEQIRLSQFCQTLEWIGSRFILSNSDVRGNDPDNSFFDDLYTSFTIRRVYATRMVNANPDKRGKLTELMISNY